MRILQIAPPWTTVPPTGHGGIGSVISSLSDGLTALGHDVTLVASGDSETSAELVSALDASTPPQSGAAWLEAAHAVTAYLHAEHVDVIHDHSGFIGPSIAAVARLHVPVINTLHSPWTAESTVLYRAISRRIALTAISHDQAGRAPEGVRVAAVVHNGLELDAYPVGHEREDFLLFVGDAVPDNGAEVAIEVARRLGTRLVMALHVAGPDEQRFLEQIIHPRLAGVDVDLRSTSTREERTDLLCRAHALIAPIGRDEPFGLEMAEAAACGAPVVAFRRGCAPELVLDGISGRLVAPGDIDAMTDAVAEVAAFDPLDCRAWAEGRFSARRMVNRYLRVYEELASRTGTNGASRRAEQDGAREAARALHPSSRGRPLRVVPDVLSRLPSTSNASDLA
jgi:glycosyltransferase involved in cell wall biosynthesis